MKERATSRTEPTEREAVGAPRHEEQLRVRAADELVLIVRDNGRDMPADAVESGLSNIRQRAERHGGVCVISAAEPSGTVIERSVPLRREA